MADGRLPGQAVDRRGVGEMIADQTLSALGVKPRSVESDDARRLLSPVLEGVQPERDDRGGVGMPEDTEDTAFLVQPVFLQIDAEGVGRIESAIKMAPCSVRCRRLACPAIIAWESPPAAAGAGWGTFLLMSASSLCLSREVEFAAAAGGVVGLARVGPAGNSSAGSSLAGRDVCRAI